MNTQEMCPLLRKSEKHKLKETTSVSDLPDELNAFYLYVEFLFACIITDILLSLITDTGYFYVFIVFSIGFVCFFSYWQILLYLVYRVAACIRWMTLAYDAIFHFTRYHFQWMIVTFSVAMVILNIIYTLFVFKIEKLTREVLRDYSIQDVRKSYWCS